MRTINTIGFLNLRFREAREAFKQSLNSRGKGGLDLKHFQKLMLEVDWDSCQAFPNLKTENVVLGLLMAAI